MAQKVQVLLVDDIDGSPAHETVNFALDGAKYEIDLTSSHAAELRDALAPWIGAGRKASTRPGSRPRAASGGDVSKIRAWAKSHGYAVSDRGRIPANVRDAYNSSH